MDIEVYGFTFSDFIVRFKKTYRIDSNNYDYMSFLERADYGSYVVLAMTYENPNDVLNFLLTSALNNIDVVSGENGQSGGVNFMTYVIILLMFCQAISVVFAGPEYDTAVMKFGIHRTKWEEISSSWPAEKSRPEEGMYKTKGYLYGEYDLTSSQKQQLEADLLRYNNALTARAGLVDYRNSQIEAEKQQRDIVQSQTATEYTNANAQLEQSKAQLEQSKAQLEQSKAHTATTVILGKVFDEFSKIKEQNQEVFRVVRDLTIEQDYKDYKIFQQSETIGMLKGALYMIAAGAVAFCANYLYSKRDLARLETGNVPQRQLTNGTQGQLTNATQRQLTNGTQGQLTNATQGQLTNGTQGQLTNATQGQLTIVPQGQLNNVLQNQFPYKKRGGKTHRHNRKYKKRHTKRRR
jgi:hypothetical protein